MWASYLEISVTYTGSWSQTTFFGLCYSWLANHWVSLLLDLCHLMPCDIPSSNLFFTLNVSFLPQMWKAEITPLSVCRAECPQWQGMAYEMCSNSMASQGPWNWCEPPPYSHNFQCTPVFCISHKSIEISVSWCSIVYLGISCLHCAHSWFSVY